VVPLASLPALFQGGESKPFAAITFDDGLRDGYDSALPILENMGLPATFFITTKYIGGLHPVFYGSEECMSERHIAALSSRGFFLGAHTVTHPMLGNLSNSDAQWEISESKRIIEEIIGERVMSFAYPKGHYTDSTKRIVASLGFTNAVTVREGSCVVNEDPFALPRIAIDRGTGRLQFKGKLSRALYPYERVKKLYVGR
jgi:peptidoglycan/xylan/chitin deacetylase (PgdA/CDA1 family)